MPAWHCGLLPGHPQALRLPAQAGRRPADARPGLVAASTARTGLGSMPCGSGRGPSCGRGPCGGPWPGRHARRRSAQPGMPRGVRQPDRTWPGKIQRRGWRRCRRHHRPDRARRPPCGGRGWGGCVACGEDHEVGFVCPATGCAGVATAYEVDLVPGIGGVQEVQQPRPPPTPRRQPHGQDQVSARAVGAAGDDDGRGAGVVPPRRGPGLGRASPSVLLSQYAPKGVPALPCDAAAREPSPLAVVPPPARVWPPRRRGCGAGRRPDAL
jgi:hypothetical protein